MTVAAATAVAAAERALIIHLQRTPFIPRLCVEHTSSGAAHAAKSCWEAFQAPHDPYKPGVGYCLI